MDENTGINKNIKGQKYKNIGENIDNDKISKEMAEIYKKKILKFLMKL